MIKAHITVEDCFTGTVDVLKIDHEGIRCIPSNVTSCYHCQKISKEEIFIKWNEDFWWLDDSFTIEEPEYSKNRYHKPVDELYEEVFEELEGFIDPETYDGKRMITQALGLYLNALDEAEDDRCSGDIRREYYALSPEACLEQAVQSIKNLYILS